MDEWGRDSKEVERKGQPTRFEFSMELSVRFSVQLQFVELPQASAQLR